MEETHDPRIDSLAAALTTATVPLIKLFERADALEKQLRAHDYEGASAIAAEIRVQALTARADLDRSLVSVQRVAGTLSALETYFR
jgi:hypothetical protein